MNAVAAFASILELAVASLALIMAVKCLRATSLLPFHAAAAGIPWPNIEARLQSVLLALLKISGLGFLTVSLLLVAATSIHFTQPGSVVLLLAPAVSLPFTFGLSLVNHRLHHQAGVPTPWRGALAASAVLAICIVLALGSRAAV